ncbi:hypothetical protein ACUXQ2_005479 [Cupriavidus metallidurans]
MLPKYRGTGKRASDDGTKWNLYERAADSVGIPPDPQAYAIIEELDGWILLLKRAV